MRGKETRQVPVFLEFTIRWWKQTAKQYSELYIHCGMAYEKFKGVLRWSRRASLSHNCKR